MSILDGQQLDVIPTERLRLRTPRRSDTVAVDEAIQETLDELVLWLPWARPGHTRGDSRRYLRGARAARARRHSYEYVMEDRATRALLGMASLHRIDWFRRSAGIGYWVRKSAWGKGIATEAARAVLNAAFCSFGLHRIEVHVALENKKSQRVAEKLGLQREGVARGVEYVGGRHLDHVQYAVLRSDLMGGDG